MSDVDDEIARICEALKVSKERAQELRERLRAMDVLDEAPTTDNMSDYPLGVLVACDSESMFHHVTGLLSNEYIPYDIVDMPAERE